MMHVNKFWWSTVPTVNIEACRKNMYGQLYMNIESAQTSTRYPFQLTEH